MQQHSKVNKMNVENLATVMGINLLKPQIEDPITVMKGENTSCILNKHNKHVVANMLIPTEHYGELRRYQSDETC